MGSVGGSVDSGVEATESRPVPAAGTAPTLASLAGALTDTLPTGSSVVVRWRDPDTGEGPSEAAGAPPWLHVHGDGSLDGETPQADGHATLEHSSQGHARSAQA